MSETSFSINDLLRRKLQTSLVVVSLALSVASTLFLLLFAEKIGFGISLMVENRLTAGFSVIFSPFILLLAILILVAGAVMVSFMVSLMMSQRTRDIGLMKAAGCPNDLVFGYFFNELFIVILLGSLAGTMLGLLTDAASTSLLVSLGLQVTQVPFNLWLTLLVFFLFFVLALIMGTKPIFDASRTEPIKAISPTYHFGTSKEPGLKILSTSNLPFKIALRSLIRHKSATIKIVLCMSIVFTLVTVGIAGGLISDRTTKNWIEKAIGTNTVLVAHQEMCSQYRFLVRQFYEGGTSEQCNYTDSRYLIPENLLDQLSSRFSGIRTETRIVLEAEVREVQGYVLGNTTQDTRVIGDTRKGQSIIVGVDPRRVLNAWFLDGRFLDSDQSFEVVIGDSLSRKLFSEPLLQNMKVFEKAFDVVGVCVDPLNNGNVAYVPFRILENATGVSGPNVVMARFDSSVDRVELLKAVNETVKAVNSEFRVLDLDELLEESLGFVGYMWSTVMLLPLFSLVAASLCLVGYVMLAIDEQRQEFGVLRAIGAKPRMVLSIMSRQNLLVLLSSYGIGIALGIIVITLILVREPLVTVSTVVEIAGWLTIALAATFLSSLYPALRFAKKPVLELIMQT